MNLTPEGVKDFASAFQIVFISGLVIGIIIGAILSFIGCVVYGWI